MSRGDINDLVTGGHWHGGPDPCPVCGGLVPHLRPKVASKVLGIGAARLGLAPPLASEPEVDDDRP